MSVTEIQLFQILRHKLGEKEAQTLVTFVREEVKTEFDNRREMLAAKEDIYLLKKDLVEMKTDLLRTVYVVGLVQFLAIIGSVLLIVNFMLK